MLAKQAEEKPVIQGISRDQAVEAANGRKTLGKEKASKDIQRSIAYTLTTKEADKLVQMYADWVSPLEIFNAVACGHEKGKDIQNKSQCRAVGPKLVFVKMTEAFGARTRKEHLIADPCEKWWA